MEEKAKEKLAAFDRKASKAVRVIGYVIFALTSIFFLFLTYSQLTSTRSAGDHTRYTKLSMDQSDRSKVNYVEAPRTCGGLSVDEAVWQKKKEECTSTPDRRLICGCHNGECSFICIGFTLNPG